MMKGKNAYLLILLLAIGARCRKENMGDCFKGNGHTITQERGIDPFEYIEIFDKMDVTISRGSEYSIVVMAGNRIIKNIMTTVNGNTLTVENKNTCNFVRGYKHTIKVHITLPYLKMITNNSVGPVYFSEDFTQDTLVVRAESSGDFYLNGKFNQLRTSSHGNGDIYINGSCNSFYAYANGTNFLFADNFRISEYAFIHSITYGDCHINATGLKELQMNIMRDGNLYYRGEPGKIIDFSDGTARGRAIKEE